MTTLQFDSTDVLLLASLLDREAIARETSATTAREWRCASWAWTQAATFFRAHGDMALCADYADSRRKACQQAARKARMESVA